MINSFDFPTTISPDMKKGNEEYASISIEYTDDIRKLKNKYDLTSDNTILSLFPFNLLKFSFSKDILVAYNKKAVGYHFNTELSVKDYLNYFKSEYDKLEKYEDKSFDSEILFTTQKYNKEDYKFIFSHDKSPGFNP